MSRMRSGADAAGYQLRGEIDGRDQRLRLASGVNRCGSSPDNDFVLTSSGVSRRHLEIEVGSDHLMLADLGSKNGTFVNGRRAHRAHLKPGDEIGIGELNLRLERIEADDAVLGLELTGVEQGAGVASSPSFAEHETTRLMQGAGVEVVGSWLELIDAFAGDLFAGAGEQLSTALRRITLALEVGACCLVERAPGGVAGILAAAGDAGGPEVEAGLEAFLAATREPPAGGQPADVRTFHSGGAAPVTGSALVTVERPPLGLMVAGPVAAPTEVECLLGTLLRLLAHLRLGASAPRRAGPALLGLQWPDGYVPGTSAAMSALHDQVRAVAPGDVPVLILGETGAGKELIARLLHASSPRREHAFVALNCAAIPADLLEAEVFGVEKGAATGVTRRPGIFRRAHLGTLFLDEIGDMPAELQAKLLRALQEREIQPVGGTPQEVDVRVVSATNLDLRARIAAGGFRSDLYYRLAGHVLPVPPLRQRAEDLHGLIEHFLRDACDQLGKTLSGVTVKALSALATYPWPGNVRELEHEIRRLAALCREAQPIDFELLSEPVKQGAPELEALLDEAAPVPVAPSVAISEDDGRFHLASHEKRMIRQALVASGGQLTAAARRLGISRDALRRRLSRHGLQVERRP